MTAGAVRRAIVWAAESPATKMRLVINDLDKQDDAINAIQVEARETRAMMRRKLNILMTVASGLLVAFSANLLVLLLTR